MNTTVNGSFDEPPFFISGIAMILFSLSQMLDSGELDHITIEDVKRHSRAGDLLDYLKSINGGSFVSGWLDAHPALGAWWAAQIAENVHAMDRRERRKYGIEKRGLCLLISYTAEIIQTNRIPLVLTDHGTETVKV